MMILTSYFGAGLAFAIWFVAHGVHRIDPLTRHTGIGFRLLILPGSALLWPYLLKKVRR
jgi:hypothetical protein